MLTGFRNTDNLAFGGKIPERNLVAAWHLKHPEAVFWTFVRNPRRKLSDTIPVEVQWYGHRWHKQTLRLWPASQHVFTVSDAMEQNVTWDLGATSSAR